MKAFVDDHGFLFADDPVPGVEMQQEAFARNILLWVKPLLVNQPWRAQESDCATEATDVISLRAAHINLRRAMANLGHPELHSNMFFWCL